MALDNCCFFPPPMDWELHALGGAHQEGVHETFPSCAMESPASSEASSGCLQGAVVHWGDRPKRRQTAAARRRHAAAVQEDLPHHLDQNFWDFRARDPFHDVNIVIPESSFVSADDALKDVDAAVRAPAPQAREGAVLVRMQCCTASLCNSDRVQIDGSNNTNSLVTDSLKLYNNSVSQHQISTRLLITADASHGAYSDKYSEQPEKSSSNAASTCASCSSPTETGKEGVGVLYPFAVVKPLGLDGGTATTLDDINRRILGRPARPVRHPVGRFACRPAVSPRGQLGLSGKAIVSLARISTAGKGTITVIRTRG